MSGTNAGIGVVAAAATVDPDPCNALTDGPSGLLVPSTSVEGIAPGTAVGTGRSVDVDVIAPAAGACPQDWQVGARLTPAYGEEFLPAFVNLVATPSGTWVNTALSVVLPEAGVYEVTAAVHSVITTNPTSGPYSIGIVARLYDVTVGAPSRTRSTRSSRTPTTTPRGPSPTRTWAPSASSFRSLAPRRSVWRPRGSTAPERPSLPPVSRSRALAWPSRRSPTDGEPGRSSSARARPRTRPATRPREPHVRHERLGSHRPPRQRVRRPL